MHLTSLAFLSLRFKDLQEQEEQKDESASGIWLDSDDTSDMSGDQSHNELDAISLNFDEIPDRPTSSEGVEDQDYNAFGNRVTLDDIPNAKTDTSLDEYPGNRDERPFNERFFESTQNPEREWLRLPHIVEINDELGVFDRYSDSWSHHACPGTPDRSISSGYLSDV
ncbi:hypothetical protein QQX98_004322 [Neonectria punicea]|uniref:Uncharacterized protein n=1 Tax=Neonectria punicea TaxID=979145 RepID=A0ABR1HA91_9HYPO